jgi:GntR family transcriptional regulator, transcriptional repressor for pyruvate dehydrogenase complex
MFKQIKIRKISEEIVDQIKTAILEGKLKPGEKLPPERELIKELGISRVSLREALNSLESMGFVEIRQGGGSYVRSVVADRVKDPLNLMIKENVNKVFDLIKVRKGLETWAVSHAASQATESDIDALERIVKAMEKELEERIFSYKSDADFHLALSLASHNTIQAHLMFTIYDLLSEYLLFLNEKTHSNQEIRNKLYQQHLRIFNAIKERNSESAQREVMEHLTFVEGELKRLLLHD